MNHDHLPGSVFVPLMVLSCLFFDSVLLPAGHWELLFVSFVASRSPRSALLHFFWERVPLLQRKIGYPYSILSTGGPFAL